MTRLADRPQRIAAVLAAAAAMIAGSTIAAPAPARAEDGFEWTVTIATPDAEYGKALCTTSVSLQVGAFGSPVVLEQAVGTVSSSGCGPLAWDPVISMSDRSLPWYEGYDALSGGDESNPTTAAVTQNVEYGVGVREAGVILVRFEATSRVGYVCYEVPATYDAISWSARPLAPYPCGM